MPYEEVDKTNFLTMSAHGVMQHIMADTVFTHLDKWEAEYNMYCRLMRIKSFFHFRCWKAFYVWKKGIIYKKFSKASNHIENNLFILIPNLRSTLIDVQEMCCNMITTSFTDVTNIEGWEMFYFIEAQVEF